MTREFSESMTKSLAAWNEYVVPIAPMMVSGGLVTVEGRTDEELALVLDRLCGIDAFSVNGDLVQGIASRIQVIKRIHGQYKPFNTFTVRESRSTGSETEWKKRVAAMRDGFVFPRLTSQAYVTDWTGGRLLTMAVCFTRDLFDFLESHPDMVKHRTTPDEYGGVTTFAVVSWRDMVRCGYLMRILCQDGTVRTYNRPAEEDG